MSESFIASIFLFGGNFPIRGWAQCDGQIMSIAQNTAVFALLGTTYGGNGQTTFALPDLRGRAPISPGQGPGLTSHVLGEAAGTPTVTMTLSQLPSHSHQAVGGVTVSVSGNSANTDEAAGSLLANTNAPFYNTGSTPGQFLNGTNLNLQEGPAGGSQPISIMQPYLAVNYLICLQGIFPSRN